MNISRQMTLFFLITVIPQALLAQTTDQEINKKFADKVDSYIRQSEIRFTLEDVVQLKPAPAKPSSSGEEQKLPEEPAKKLNLVLSVCRPGVHKDVLVYPTMKEIRDHIVARIDRKRVAEPLFRREDRPFDECLELIKFKHRENKKVLPQSYVVKTSELLNHSMKYDILNPNTYFRLNGFHPFLFGKKLVSSYDIDTDGVLQRLAINSNRKAYKVKNAGGFDLGVSIKLTHTGSQTFNPLDLKDKEKLNPHFVIDVLSKNKELEDLFSSDAGVSEGYSIKEHSLRVMELINSQYACHISPEFEDRMRPILGVSVKNFMDLTMSLHDIGKPLAVRAGDKGRQHEFTRPIVEKTMAALGFSQFAIHLAAELVDNDIIGDYLKGTIRQTEKAHQLLVDQSAKMEMDLKDYFTFQMLFYTADAGAYPGLMLRVFKENKETKCVRPVSPKYKSLEDKILK